MVGPKRDIFAVQSNCRTSISALSRLRNEKTTIKSYSQSLAKNFSDHQETQASVVSNSQAENHIPLAAISQSQKSQKKVNNKVQVFEIEEYMKDLIQQLAIEKQVTKKTFAKI